LPILPCAEKLELVLSTAPSTKDTICRCRQFSLNVQHVHAYFPNALQYTVVFLFATKGGLVATGQPVVVLNCSRPSERRLRNQFYDSLDRLAMWSFVLEATLWIALYLSVRLSLTAANSGMRSSRNLKIDETVAH